MVDDQDYEYLTQWKWCFNGRCACRGIGGRQNYRTILMHRVVAKRAGLPLLNEIDHRDGDPLNNHRANLRPATRQQNQRNRGKQANNKSGYKGVAWHQRAQKWEAYIHHNRRKEHLGLFTRRKDAARAYNHRAITLHGEYASLNEV